MAVDAGNPIDGLAPRVKAAIALGYLVTVALVLLLPLAWGSRTALDNLYAIVPAIGLTWFAAFGLAAGALARRWPRVTIVAPALAPPIDEDDEKARRLVVASARRWGRWRAARWLVLVPAAGVVWWAASGTLHDAEVAAHEPRVTAPVVAVERDMLPNRGGGPDGVTVELDGQRVELYGDLPDAEVGDRVVVVVDPTTPDHVMDVATHSGWIYSPVGAFALGIGLCAIPVAIVLMSARPRGAQRSLRNARTVEVISFERVDKGTLRVEAAHGTFRWVEASWPEDVQSGRCRAVGEIVAGSWVALVRDGFVEWPDEPLQLWADDVG
ncbi:hypothetical protein [Cellulomonas sp. P5_C6]